MSDLKKRIAGLVPGTEQHARNNVAKQVKEARQHRDRFKGNYPDTSAKPLELQPGAIKDGYDKIKDKPKEILAKKNLKESTMGTFQSRLLEEEYGQYAAPAAAAPSLGSRVKDNVKSNWKQYAGGAALGGLGAMLGDHFTDTVGDFNDDMQTAAGSGNYINTGLDKMQGGLEAMKIGDGSDSNTSGGSTSGGSTTGGSRGEFVSGTDTQRGVPSTDALKAMGLAYGGANDDVSNRAWNFADHLKSRVTGNADVAAGGISDENVAKSTIDRLGYESKDMNDYKDALQRATADGKISPDEAREIQGFKDRMGANNTSLWDKAQGLVYGQDNIQAEKMMERQLQNSMDFAKENKLDFLLKGDIQDDIQYFKDVQNRFGYIPDELQPIYQAVMRKANG